MFYYEGRQFKPTEEMGPYVVAQSPPTLIHLQGELQDAVFNKETGRLVAGPWGEGYRAKLFVDQDGHKAVRLYHWHNGPQEGYYLLQSK